MMATVTKLTNQFKKKPKLVMFVIGFYFKLWICNLI